MVIGNNQWIYETSVHFLPYTDPAPQSEAIIFSNNQNAKSETEKVEWYPTIRTSVICSIKSCSMKEEFRILPAPFIGSSHAPCGELAHLLAAFFQPIILFTRWHLIWHITQQFVSLSLTKKKIFPVEDPCKNRSVRCVHRRGVKSLSDNYL